MIFENAKWIWRNTLQSVNEYVEFHERFSYSGGTAILRLCAETDYTVHLNGKQILMCQFANYRNEKYYNEDDISDLCQQGENTLVITVRYEGVDSSCHVRCGAGVIYSLEQNGVQTLYSSADTLCRPSPYYLAGENRHITGQLGLCSTMINPDRAPSPLEKARETELPRSFVKRPVKRFDLLDPVVAKPLDIEGKRIYDLGREECGYLFVRVSCSAPSTVKIAYGEHLDDGEVRYLIHNRNFSLDFKCNKGENYFEQFFVRIAGRYLQLITPDDAQILEIGIIPAMYPLTEKSSELTGINRAIYDTCVRTLRLCMHTHYEDCPWREQALYVLDSRNQMLCGYTAFAETEFQRANLVFISKGRREDGMLELTYPAENTPAIPFFSAMYPVAVCEYIEHTGDVSIANEVIPTMLSIIDRLYSFKNDQLIVDPHAPYWNFYEWSKGNEGALGNDDGGKCDLILNCAFVYSVEHLQKICVLAGIKCPEYDLSAMRSAIVDTFFDSNTGIFRACDTGGIPSALGNAFALLIGLGDERTVNAIKEGDILTPATLSMLGFVYDALLLYPDNEDHVLNDIREKYSYMLSKGATSFWETIEGGDAFGKAGSLCHGWSAIPIHYLSMLIEKEKKL